MGSIPIIPTSRKAIKQNKGVKPLNVEKRKLTELLPAEYNPRKKLQPGDKEYEKIKRSIEKFGYIDPIIINKDGTIIGGHQRYSVLEELGYEEIDVVVVDLDKEHEKALNLALNKITGEWDDNLLTDLIRELSELDFEMELTGFDSSEIDLMLDTGMDADFEDESKDEDEIEKSDTAVIVGEYRISIPRATYMDWINKVRMDVGFDKDSVEKEILRRLEL